MTSLPREFSRRSPDSVIEPSGNASAAATASRNGVVAVTRSTVRLDAAVRGFSRADVIRKFIELDYRARNVSGEQQRIVTDRCSNYILRR